MFPLDLAPKEIVWFLLGILSSAIIGYVFYRVGPPKKKLSYSVERRRILWTVGNNPGALKISFNDKPREGPEPPHSLHLELRNATNYGRRFGYK